MRKFHIFTDLDGTLLGKEDYRYEVNVQLISDLKLKGIGVSLNTSKTLSETECWQYKLGLDSPFIVENGAAIVDGDFAGEVAAVSDPGEALIKTGVGTYAYSNVTNSREANSI